jgi:signal transduction histidine kinase
MNSKAKTLQRILLIDDSEEDRARVRAALIQGAPSRRYMFKEANNGEEGLKLAEMLGDQWPIDCVIIDVHMPRLTGTDFLKKISQQNNFPVLPVVVLTGSTVHADSHSALQLGAQDYITKDAIYPAGLFRIVDNAIERHRLTAELNESRVVANSANRAKSAMIGNISHEIRTPMTAVMGLCDLLLDSDLSEDQARLLTMVRDNGEYLVEIVNDLLDLSKLEAKRVELDIKPFDLHQMLTRLVEMMTVRAFDSSCKLELHIAETVPVAIKSDPLRLRQVILNLVSNAVKFSPGGKVTLEVDVTKEPQQENALRIRVIDTGVGISKEDQNTIFQPFVQAEIKGKAKSVGGTGLGLAICQRMTKLLGGKLFVQSEVDVGSTFSFLMPLESAEIDAIEAARPSVQLSCPVEELLTGCKIAVAEDTPATRFLIRRMLEAAGVEVVEAVDGNELIETLRQSPESFAAVITDVQMPGMDGLEATRKLRKSGHDLPIIVLTADVVNETRAEAEKAGASTILAKPINRSELLEAIAECCEKARS